MNEEFTTADVETAVAVWRAQASATIPQYSHLLYDPTVSKLCSLAFGAGAEYMGKLIKRRLLTDEDDRGKPESSPQDPPG